MVPLDPSFQVGQDQQNPHYLAWPLCGPTPGSSQQGSGLPQLCVVRLSEGNSLISSH